MKKKLITVVFILSVLLTTLSEYFDLFYGVLIFKPLIVISICLLYWTTSKHRSNIYMVALGFALAFNFFYLKRDDGLLLFLGALCSIFFVAICIVIVLRQIKLKNLLTVALICTPLLAFSFYTLTIVDQDLGISYWPIIIGMSLVCLFSGLSTYSFFNTSSMNSSNLIISGICMFLMGTLFGIETYFFESKALRAPIIWTYGIFHYTFYRYVVESESPKSTSFF